MTNEVYITKAAKFLPNQPILNDEMEDYLGKIHQLSSKSRRIVLRNNGIKTRYYAIDKNGTPTHTNAQMAALAIRNLMANDDSKLKAIDLLCCGTSSPDQMMPSHGVMVHGWLPETKEIEVITPSGNCCAGMHALKYAWMSVKLGEAENAVTTGSERLSRIMRSEVFEEEANKLEAAEKNPYITFDKEFLRWMLSDGAAAMQINKHKNETGLSLRIDGIECASFANQMESCMYMAAEKLPGGTLKSFMDYSPAEIIDHSILSIKQDVKMLSENIVELGVLMFKPFYKKYNIAPSDVDYFLPHMSSEFFRSKIAEKMNAFNISIPQEKWFSNLVSVGNVGAASIYMMIEELLASNKLQKGQRIVLLVPESARFSYVFALLTVV